MIYKTSKDYDRLYHLLYEAKHLFLIQSVDYLRDDFFIARYRR